MCGRKTEPPCHGTGYHNTNNESQQILASLLQVAVEAQPCLCMVYKLLQGEGMVMAPVQTLHTVIAGLCKHDLLPKAVAVPAYRCWRPTTIARASSPTLRCSRRSSGARHINSAATFFRARARVGLDMDVGLSAGAPSYANIAQLGFAARAVTA